MEHHNLSPLIPCPPNISSSWRRTAAVVKADRGRSIRTFVRRLNRRKKRRERCCCVGENISSFVLSGGINCVSVLFKVEQMCEDDNAGERGTRRSEDGNKASKQSSEDGGESKHADPTNTEENMPDPRHPSEESHGGKSQLRALLTAHRGHGSPVSLCFQEKAPAAPPCPSQACVKTRCTSCSPQPHPPFLRPHLPQLTHAGPPIPYHQGSTSSPRPQSWAPCTPRYTPG